MRHFELALLLVSLLAVLFLAKKAAFESGHLGRSPNSLARFESQILPMQSGCFAMQKKYGGGLLKWSRFDGFTRLFWFDESCKRWREVKSPYGAPWHNPELFPGSTNNEVLVVSDSSPRANKDLVCRVNVSQRTAQIVFRSPEGCSVGSLTPLVEGRLAILQNEPNGLATLRVAGDDGFATKSADQFTKGLLLETIPNSNSFLMRGSREVDLFRLAGSEIRHEKNWRTNDPHRPIDVQARQRRLLLERNGALELLDQTGTKGIAATEKDLAGRHLKFRPFRRPLWRGWSGRSSHPDYFELDRGEHMSPDGRIALTLLSKERFISFSNTRALTMYSTAFPRKNGVKLRDRFNGQLLATFEASWIADSQLRPSLWLGVDGTQVFHSDQALNVRVMSATNGQLIETIPASKPALFWLFLGVPVWTLWWFSFSRRNKTPVACIQLVVLILIVAVVFWRFQAIGFAHDYWRAEWLLLAALLGCMSQVVSTHACWHLSRLVPRLIPATLLLGVAGGSAFLLWGPQDTYHYGNAPEQWPFQQLLIRFSLVSIFLAIGTAILSKHINGDSGAPTRWTISIVDCLVLTGIVAAAYSFLVRLHRSHWGESLHLYSLLDSLVWSIVISVVVLTAWFLLLKTSWKLRTRLLFGAGSAILLVAAHYLWERHLYLAGNKSLFQQKAWASAHYWFDSFTVIATFAAVRIWFAIPEKLEKYEMQNTFEGQVLKGQDSKSS